MNKKIIFTGGHHNSALLIAQSLKAKGYQIYWFGHKSTMRGEKSLSLEYQEVTAAKIPFFEIKSSKFHQDLSIINLPKLGWGFIQALINLIKIKPGLIVSFGAYLSVPVVIAGKILGIKNILFEQTSRVGLANQLLEKFSNRILLAWPESKQYFSNRNVKIVGLPLNQEIFNKKENKNIFPQKKPVILVTGGKQGAQVINKIILENLEQILVKFNLIHQSGGQQKTQDYQKLFQRQQALPLNLKSCYRLEKYFYSTKMTQMLKRADLVISRAGAHIIYELLALGKKAILIPLPWAYKQEQNANSQILKKLGMAIIINQDELTWPILKAKIELILRTNLTPAQIKNAQKLVRKEALHSSLLEIESLLKK